MEQIDATKPQELLEVGIDWITATVKHGHEGQVIKGRVAAWQQQREREGYKPRGFANPFYKGVSCGGVTFGERHDDNLLTLSGSVGRRWGATVITWAYNISRLDVQATLRDDRIDRDWAGRVDLIAGQHNLVKAGQLSTRLIRRRPEGVTAYIGDPGSDRMLRCYDKYAESDHEYPMGAWRWEVQYRKARANAVAQQLLVGDRLPHTCLDAVCKAFASYGISLPTTCIETGWRERTIRQASDDTRRLEWLKRCVAPMVERLRDAHATEEVLDALGLADVIDTLEGLQMTAKAAADLANEVDREHLHVRDPASAQS